LSLRFARRGQAPPLANRGVIVVDEICCWGNAHDTSFLPKPGRSIQAQPNNPPKQFTNSIGMTFVWIRPGTFKMGSPKEEKDRNAVEVEHTVELTKGFFMGVYPVTQEQWHGEVIRDYVKPWEGFDLANPSRFRSQKKLPVETVSWDDCQGFIKKLREKDKQRYRLPTEAEWEYACRAGTSTPFYFGETISTDQANYSGGTAVGNGKQGVNRKKTTPVGSFPPNAWGLYDMHGNVAQWCQDRFSSYTQQRAVDPQGGEKGGSRILRGGSWEDAPARCRAACRAWDSPNNRGRGTFGFRLCFFPE
jgi:formylglycine-generating enzyme required for sulfatase activity